MDYELIWWVAAGVVGLVGFCAFLIAASRSVDYVDDADRDSRYVRGWRE